MDWYTIFQIILTILLIQILLIVYRSYGKRRVLHWIPEVPGIPILGNTLELADTSKTLDVFQQYLNKYSGLCRIKLIYDISILVSDPIFVEFVLSSNKLIDKGSEYKFLMPWLGEGLLTATGEKWKKSRKILTPAFHFSILEQFISIFDSNGQTLLEILDQRMGKTLNVVPFIAMCTLDVICESAMGVSINAQKNVNSEYVHSVQQMCRVLIDRSFSLKRYDLFYPFYKDFYMEKKYVNTLHEFTNSVIKSRKNVLDTAKLKEDILDENGKRRKLAFLDILLKAQQNGADIDDTFIREEVDTFMFEGYDTTTSAVCFILYCLAKYPEYQDLAFDEQKLLFSDHKNISVTMYDLQEMKFLELFIKESLRLFPPVPYFARRVKEDIVYRDGNVIPKDINIIIAAIASNRNPIVFENPKTFDPFRFQSMENKEWYYSYLPFSAGPRNCIGQKFAMLEIKSLVSKMIRNYVMELSGPENEPILVAEAVLSSANGINLKLTKRQW